jgi:hypothetical protein
MPQRESLSLGIASLLQWLHVFKGKQVSSIVESDTKAGRSAHRSRTPKSGAAWRSATQPLTLADPESAQALAEFRAEVLKSPDAAKAWLHKVGILTASGRVSRRFGGK